MSSEVHFQQAVNILEALSLPKATPAPVSIGEGEYAGQHVVTTALKIINEAALYGTAQQKQELSLRRRQVTALNAMIKDGTLEKIAREKLGVELGQESTRLTGMQIALPKTKLQSVIDVATRIPRIVFTVLVDLLLLPGALGLLIAAKCQANFNPKSQNVKVGKTPILLLHGSGFNESEWIIGRLFLKKPQYGSVFSLNYDGLVTNEHSKGIEDYARDKISAEVKRIQLLTGSDRIILMGHSMGGMIAGYYAEHVAESDRMKVEHVISLASPWQGTPMVDAFWKLGGRFSKERETKRHQQMSVSGGTNADPHFRQSLVAKALHSERGGIRKYYNAWSTTDYAVPGAQGRLTEDPRRQRSFNYLGHYGIVVWPAVWQQARAWLDDIYRLEKSVVYS